METTFTLDIICPCKSVTKFEVEKAIKNGAKSIEDIRWNTNACKDNKCHEKHPNGISCEEEIKQLIKAEHGCVEDNCSCCGG